jgi:MazG family protein
LTVSRENGGAKAPAPAPKTGRAGALAPEDHARHGLADGLAGLRQLMDRLLGPDGCPWDRAQTLDSLRPYLLEEAHEVLESMDDPRSHRQELGDLLFQIVFQSAIREREGHFDLDGVIEAIRSKMIRRHPHVFAPEGEAKPRDAHEVAARWSELKAAEREDPDGPRDPLAGVPKTLPALQRAWRLQDKAAGVGFDWPDVDGALDKVREEWGELEQAIRSGDRDRIEDELGDLLFVLTRVGQKLGVEAEGALRRTNQKFERRFALVMKLCHDAGLEPAAAGLEQLDAFWNEAKRRGL